MIKIKEVEMKYYNENCPKTNTCSKDCAEWNNCNNCNEVVGYTVTTTCGGGRMNNLLSSHDMAIIRDVVITDGGEIKVSYYDFNDYEYPDRTMYYDTFKAFMRDIRGIKKLYWMEEVEI